MFLNIKLDPMAEVLLKKRALFTFLTIAIGSVVVLGNLHYQLATSVDSIMAQGDEYKAEVDQARIDFPGSPSVLFAFESDPDIFNLQALSAIEELGQRYTEIDSAVAVASILNYPMSDEDTEKFGRRYLIPELENWSVELSAQVRKLAMADEDLTKRLLSKSGEMTIANVKYKDNEDSRDSRIRIAESILALRDSLRSNYPDVRVYVVGGPLFDYDSYQASIRDNQFLFPLLLCLVPILLLFCLKSAWSAFCLSFMTLFTIALAAGTYSWLGIPFNSISRLGPMVVFVVAIADGIHIASVYTQGLARGLRDNDAMLESLKINFVPVTVATITTTMGFLSLNFSSSPAIYGFGNVIALGVLWAFVLTFTLLPGLILFPGWIRSLPLMTRLRTKMMPLIAGSRDNSLETSLGSLGPSTSLDGLPDVSLAGSLNSSLAVGATSFPAKLYTRIGWVMGSGQRLVSIFISSVTYHVHKRPNFLLASFGALIIGTLCLLPLNKLDFNQYSFVDEDSDAHYVIQALREKIGNDQALVYVVRSNEYYGITKPDFLREVDRFSIWLEEQEEATFVASYTDYLKSRNKSDEDDEDAEGELPMDQLTIIDYLVGYQLIAEIEPSLQPIFNNDYSAIRLVVGTSNLTNEEILGFASRIDSWATENVSDEFKITRGDNTILRARISSVLTTELMQGFAMSFVLITLTMMIGLRSVRYGLLSIMPNIFPATIVFGFWGLLVGELSPYVLMLFSISIGLVVDDSVHVLSKYMDARKTGSDIPRAIDYSLEKAGSAITVTTIVLALGTFVLIFSGTGLFQNVALLITPIVLVALFLDLLFLPPLLQRFEGWSRKNRLGPDSASI